MGKISSNKPEPLLEKVISMVRSDKDHQVQAELCCPTDFPAFEGHFPGQPILPAVIQLLVVRSLSSDLLGLPLEPVRTGRLKFKGMVGPGDRVKVRIDIKKEEGNWLSKFKLDHEGTTISSGAVIFREKV